MPWLLNLVYLVLGVAALPWLAIRRVRTGKGVAGWRTKLTGDVPQLPPADCRIWLHAVSVGEVLLLRRVVSGLQSRFPHAEIVLSTTTGTGFEVARQEFPQFLVFYFPFDFSWSVRRAIARIRPTTILLAELEVWPNLLLAADRAGVPLGIVNGRLGAKSFHRYHAIRWLIRGFFQRIQGIAAQTEEYAERFRVLGCAADRVIVTGSVKYDGLQTDRGNPRTRELRDAFGIAPDDLVFIAGSTQAPEEAIAARIWRSLTPEFPNLRLIVVPRHRERFEEVARQLESNGLPLFRRSNGNTAVPPPGAVLLLDTLGELAACWGLADIAFVGGSLTRRGGQNMIEPAGYGSAVLVGPFTHNFRQTVELLRDADAIAIVENEQQLAARIQELLASPGKRQAMGHRARTAVGSHSGATEKTMGFLEKQFRIAALDPARKAA